MADEIRYLGDLQLLKILPGDKFVLTVPKVLSDESHIQIQLSWQRFAGEDVPLLILDDGMKLGAIRVQEQP